MQKSNKKLVELNLIRNIRKHTFAKLKQKNIEQGTGKWTNKKNYRKRGEKSEHACGWVGGRFDVPFRGDRPGVALGRLPMGPMVRIRINLP